MPGNSARVVKVSPYPISVIFGAPPSTFRGKILKLTPKGFLAEVDNRQLVVRDRVEASFTLPVVGIDYKEQTVVIKTYDRKTETGYERLLEFHFTGPINADPIREFLKQIGQEK